MKAVGKGEVSEMDGRVTNIMGDATRALYDETGDKLLAFVIWQPDAKGDGGYLNIVTHRSICGKPRGVHRILPRPTSSDIPDYRKASTMRLTLVCLCLLGALMAQNSTATRISIPLTAATTVAGPVKLEENARLSGQPMVACESDGHGKLAHCQMAPGYNLDDVANAVTAQHQSDVEETERIRKVGLQAIDLAVRNLKMFTKCAAAVDSFTIPTRIK